jgi:hypothetical protein
LHLSCSAARAAALTFGSLTTIKEQPANYSRLKVTLDLAVARDLEKKIEATVKQKI